MRTRASTFHLIICFLISVDLYGQKSIEDYYIIGDSTKIFNTIDDIIQIEALRDKGVYIDLWGTRCGPCLMEFQHLPALKKTFKNDSIVFLYLCSPYTKEWNDENAELWKKLIVKHDLEGINLLMTAECYTDGLYEKYKDKFSPRTMYMIPRYLLVNKKGKIVNFNAPRPSSREKIYDAIQLLLDDK